MVLYISLYRNCHWGVFPVSAFNEGLVKSVISPREWESTAGEIFSWLYWSGSTFLIRVLRSTQLKKRFCFDFPVVSMWNFICSSFASDSLEHRCSNTRNTHILGENMNNNSDVYLLIVCGSAHIIRKILDQSLIWICQYMGPYFSNSSSGREHGD